MIDWRKEKFWLICFLFTLIYLTVLDASKFFKNFRKKIKLYFLCFNFRTFENSLLNFKKQMEENGMTNITYNWQVNCLRNHIQNWNLKVSSENSYSKVCCNFRANCNTSLIRYRTDASWWFVSQYQRVQA